MDEEVSGQLSHDPPSPEVVSEVEPQVPRGDSPEVSRGGSPEVPTEEPSPPSRQEVRCCVEEFATNQGVGLGCLGGDGGKWAVGQDRLLKLH